MKRLSRFRKAAALPFVLLLVALNVIVVVAMLVYATTELQASRNSGQAEAARAMAQSGIDLAAGLIAANSTNNGFVTYQRVTNVGGSWRLETKIANTATNASSPFIRTAVGPAVLHSGFASGTSGVDLNFAVGGDPSAGFIAPRTNLSSTWANLSTNMFRMEWVYIYRNGSTTPVGRIAYWTDDESSKLSLNYSGHPNAFNKATNDEWYNFSIKRTNGQGTEVYARNQSSTKWPIFVDLGGVAGISSNEAIAILQKRGDPMNGQVTTNYPSVLAVRVASNSVATNLPRQAELSFTATVHSMEEERSYATGRKRYDLLNVIADAPEAPTISDIRYAITNNYPAFANKYDLDGYASAMYSAVQFPGHWNWVENGKTWPPAKTYGSNKMYTRGLPLVNEVGIKATIENVNGTNNVSVEYAVELIALSQTVGPANLFPSTGYTIKYNWANSFAYPNKFEARITLPAGTSFGTNMTNTVIALAPSNSPLRADNSIAGWFGGIPLCYGPTNKAFTGAMQVLSSTNITTNIATPTWICPTNVGVDLYFDSVRYQSFSFDPTLSAVGNYTLSSNETKAVYHLVAQPRGGGGYRGDPRFSAFTNSVVSAPMSAPPLQLNSEASLGTPNTNGVGNWQVDQYTSAANSPDIVPSDLFFSWDNRGIPQWAKNKLTGAGDQFSDLGMIGDVPVTTKTGEALAWSTPRLWGRGRPTVNGQSYPPDWLLLDCFHFALFNAEPQFSGSTNRVFKSYGKMNVNSAKSFFQKPSGNANASDTIMDSITRLLMTKDVRMVFDNSPTANQYSLFTPLTTAGTQRTNFLNKVAEITATRNSSDTPYTTTFEFLGDLSASRMPGDPSWWYAPIPVPAGSTNLNSATNTTDRLAESVVRGLVNKLTTHGNQFSIFSLGQALQVANGKTNVVGEAYLQAVYERAPLYDESTGAITNSPTGAPAMRQIYLRELRY